MSTNLALSIQLTSTSKVKTAKGMEAGEINSLLEHWKFLELLELPENIDVKNINFKACSSLKKIILNGDYDSEKLNCPLMPKWIQVIYGLIIFQII